MNLDMIHLAVALASALVGAVGGLITGVWRVARIEQEIRQDLTEQIAEAIRERDGRLKAIAEQFDETLKGLRQKINDVELSTERHFVAKMDFDDFRKEYRVDMRDLKQSIAELSRDG